MGKAKKADKKMEIERGGRSLVKDRTSEKPPATLMRGISKPSPSRAAVSLGVQNKIIEKMKVNAENLSRGQRKRLAKKSNVIRRKEIGSAIVTKALKIQDGALGVTVLTHPLFQSNPIGTIHDHLENSIRLSKSV
eukprot:761508-Hanusia_phi.AAC.1